MFRRGLRLNIFSNLMTPYPPVFTKKHEVPKYEPLSSSTLKFSNSRLWKNAVCCVALKTSPTTRDRFNFSRKSSTVSDEVSRNGDLVDSSRKTNREFFWIELTDKKSISFKSSSRRILLLMLKNWLSHFNDKQNTKHKIDLNNWDNFVWLSYFISNLSFSFRNVVFLPPGTFAHDNK